MNNETIYKTVKAPEELTEHLKSNGLDRLTDREFVLDNVCPRPVSLEVGKEMEERGSFVEYPEELDFAIGYSVKICEVTEDEEVAKMIGSGKGGRLNARITPELLDKLDISPQELKEAALRNISNNFTIKHTLDVMGVDADEDEKRDNGIWVVMGSDPMTGAGAILSEEVRMEVSKLLCDDRYIVIPSSNEEVLVMHYMEDADPEGLRNIITSINNFEVGPQLKLSDSPYIVEEGGKVFKIFK